MPAAVDPRRSSTTFCSLAIPTGEHPVALVDLVCQHSAGELSLQLRADQAPQLARAELRPEAGGGQMIDEGLVDLKLDALAMGGALHAFELQIDDVADLLPLERMEDDDLIDAIEEFRPEMAAQHVHQLARSVL